MRPFLKWAGGKQRLMQRLGAKLSPGERLVEPFVGSGAVFLNTDYPRYLLADVNPDLIHCYAQLQVQADELIETTRALFIDKGNTRETFDRLRARFNQLPRTGLRGAVALEKAALFIYLNRHCFNGLCRYNKAGGFNVPFGRYAKPYFPEAEMRAFAHKLRRAEVACIDFRECFRLIQPGDVVYCDPPYVPLTLTANFTDYAEGGFSLADQETLNQLAQEASARGIPIIISNHETEFTRQLYAQAQQVHFPVRRFISCKGQQRENARELIACYA